MGVQVLNDTIQAPYPYQTSKAKLNAHTSTTTIHNCRQKKYAGRANWRLRGLPGSIYSLHRLLSREPVPPNVQTHKHQQSSLKCGVAPVEAKRTEIGAGSRSGPIFNASSGEPALEQERDPVARKSERDTTRRQKRSRKTQGTIPH
jgi:hypothetical protein